MSLRVISRQRSDGKAWQCKDCLVWDLMRYLVAQTKGGGDVIPSHLT
jgi:hypothetical protein